MKYNPKNIEKKWQKYWEENATWQAEDNSKKKKFYALIEFPYPSGDGMHVGHLRPITAMDVIQRKRRLEGYNSLYPIGMDSFGLPAENYAIKTNTPPQITTKTNIANFNKQLKMVGYGFDWSRFFSTTDQDYYRWTQWIFIQMFKQGLAYKAKENINWCPSCKIGLANEEVIGGNCERCGTPVEKKEKEQWILKITKYADRLISGLDKVDYLPAIKKQQLDWIGKSEGAEIDFAISGSEQKLKVFTTRPDTLFGVTFMAIAPEHPLIHQLESQIKNLAEVKKYVQAAQKKSDIERGQEKSGVRLAGLMAINPATKKEIPIFVADYVLTTYGTGAIMAVPAHDQRDWEFAKKYNLEIVEVIEPLFVETTGKDAVHAQEKFVERNAIVAVVKHWSEDKYLCLKWKNIDWRGFVIGGVEDGEDTLQAALREIVEETGYTSAKFIKKLGGLVHSKFYHTIKKENRFAHFQGLYFELANDKQEPVSEKEQAIQEVKWFSKEEVAPFLNIGDMSLIWERLVATKIYSGEGILVNSGQFNGLSSTEAEEKIVESVGGKMAVNYKLHDWIFSRQRYWGEPIPMVYCTKDNWQPLPESELPLVLPNITDFQPTGDGQSPLSKLDKWVKTKCPVCGGEATRETDVMPNWAGSNWYFIRYTDPQNNKKLVDPKKAKYWLPVDWYNGGMEHTNLHLLYSRFVYKFLYDIKVIPEECGDEPYKKRTAHGLILAAGGVKMSKSKGNVIKPDDIVAQYGADTLRVYEMFMGPFDQAIAWDDKGVVGVLRFLSRVFELQNKLAKVEIDANTEQILHFTTKKVSEDIENMRFNTAVAQLMILLNHLEKLSKLSEGVYADFIKLLSPFAPHLAEEVWQSMGNKKSLAHSQWPEYDEAKAQQKNVAIAIQIDGKIRDTVELAFDTEPSETLKKEILQREKVQKYLSGQEPKKFIHIKNKIISIVSK